MIRSIVTRLVLASVLAGVVSSCSLDFVKSIGVPTITLSLGDVSRTQDADSGNWELEFSIEAYSLPGSPAGVINEFDLSAGGPLSAGLRVGSCAAETAKDCGPFTKNYTIGMGQNPPASLLITGYTAMGQNGQSKHVVLGTPLSIY